MKFLIYVIFFICIDTYLQKNPYHQVMTLDTLIANLGGMMGLCMGFSLVSLVEIVYFFFQAVAHAIKK